MRAAGEHIQARGLDQVTIDEIAARAGVAKGTGFHRFGSRAGLATALLDERERRLQDQLLHGPPPLGPGVPPEERLLAFLQALAEFTDANMDLLIVSDYDTPGGRYATGAYAAWRLHTARLLEELGFAHSSDGLADALLASVSADLIRYSAVSWASGSQRSGTSSTSSSGQSRASRSRLADPRASRPWPAVRIASRWPRDRTP